jgi:hypothetical protein
LNLSALTNLFDSYNRVARLYPALLAIAPILCSAIVVFPSLVSNIPRGAAAVFAFSCLAYFLASLARSRGKKIEEQLLSMWGVLANDGYAPTPGRPDRPGNQGALPRRSHRPLPRAHHAIGRRRAECAFRGR